MKYMHTIIIMVSLGTCTVLVHSMSNNHFVETKESILALSLISIHVLPIKGELHMQFC